MPFVTRCPGCKLRLKVPDRKAGKVINCPRCSHAFQAVRNPASFQEKKEG